MISSVPLGLQNLGGGAPLLTVQVIPQTSRWFGAGPDANLPALSYEELMGYDPAGTVDNTTTFCNECV